MNHESNMCLLSNIVIQAPAKEEGSRGEFATLSIRNKQGGMRMTHDIMDEFVFDDENDAHDVMDEFVS
jgi:hypothetical protein